MTEKGTHRKKPDPVVKPAIEKTALNPSTLLAPVPVVLVSCKGSEKSPAAKPNLITLAWAGTICSEPPMVSISIRGSRYSHEIISSTGEFVINLVNERLLKATDFCGVKSGRDIDKFEQCHLTPMPIEGMEFAPAVAESPLSVACKVESVQNLGSHDLFIAKVVSVTVDSALVDKSGKLRLDKAKLVAYAHGEYYALGKLMGFFGYSVASPEVLARRMPVRARPGRK